MRTNHNEYQNKQSHHANDEISMLPFVFILFKYRWLVVMFMIAGAVIAGVSSKLMYKKSYKVDSFVLLKPSSYFTDVNREEQSNILKSTYEVVLRSNQLLEKVVSSKYDYIAAGKKESISLLKHYNTDKIGTAIKIINNNLTSTFDKKGGILLTLSYIDENSNMAAQIVNNIVRELGNYYSVQFTTLIQTNITFVTKSLANAKKELDDAKNKLDIFVITNKQLKNISEQKGQYSTCYSSEQVWQKLKEDADSKAKTYNDLKISYEKLRYQVTENASAITVLEKAAPSQDPIPCKYIKASVLGACFGLIIAAALVLLINLQTLFGLKTNHLETISTELKKDLKKLNLFKF